ncbi:TPA: hypothetical protein ACGDYM_001651 [Acinetobacter baumannii]|uniref:hypothetical protein n=1 Tax=Acinetobacter baumannii TaxID=470 RepID=UPI0007EB8AC1|nr:hypothetical protein [Acinetobacter baumannii]MDC4544956.1 hypothetical protein [Acinetobacter baumannii]SBS21233.1 Uncharacterised protein [Acinetobacter baumannii]
MFNDDRERELFVAFLRTKGILKIDWNCMGVITNIVREAGCALGYNDIELMQEVWMEKAKAQAVPSQKYFSHDFNGDGFKYHDSLEEAQKEAEASLDWYRDKVADGHHVAEDGEFYELCYGVVIASADYTVDAVVSEDHHKNDEFTKYEVGTEILRLHFNKCNSESGAEQ